MHIGGHGQKWESIGSFVGESGSRSVVADDNWDRMAVANANGSLVVVAGEKTEYQWLWVKTGVD